MPPNDPRFLELTPEECEAEYWRVEFTNKPPTEEFENEEFDDEKNAILARLEAGEDDFESIINDVYGRDATL